MARVNIFPEIAFTQGMTETKQIRILAVDDHPVVREGLAKIIAGEPDMVLVAEAANGPEAIQQFREHRPDIVLMDLQMKGMNGVDATVAIRKEFPEARVIVLTSYDGDVQALRALKVGAQAYLLKNLLHNELLDMTGQSMWAKSLPPEVSHQLAVHATDDALTPAEVVVLRLIAAGNANKEIAAQLSVTEQR